MVYKKIGDKVPCLSSLLLAGVLLGGSCPEARNKNETAAEQPVTGDGASDASGETRVNKLVVDPDLEAAGVQIIRVLIKSLGLNALAVDDPNNPFVVLTDKEMRRKADGGDVEAREVAQRLYKLSSSFVNNQVYRTLKLKDYLSDLAKLKFYVGSSFQSGVKGKYAYGQAMNKIAETVKDLVGVYKKVDQKINATPSLEAFTDIVEIDLKPLLLSLDPCKTHLKAEHDFFPSKDTEFRSGAALVDFFSTSVAGLLKQSSGRIWIKPKKAPGQDSSNRVNVHQRGSAILSGWIVNGDESGRFTIDGIPPGELVHGLLPKQLLEDVTPNDKIFIQTGDVKVGLLTDDPYACPAPAVQGDLNFGTLLFTLFRGVQSDKTFDFLELRQPESKNNKAVVQFTANYKNFKKLIDLSPGDFACALAEHINSSGLSDTFIIPNVSNLTNDILDSFTGIESGDEVNEGGGFVRVQDNASEKFTVGQGSVLAKVYRKILSNFGMRVGEELGQPDYNILAALCARQVDNISLTIEQQICLALAKVLISPAHLGLLGASRPLKVAELKDLITKKIDDVVNQAIVKIVDGRVKSTPKTGLLHECIKALHEALKRDNKVSAISYAKIKDKIKETNPNTRFNIDDIRQIIFDHCDRLNYILRLNVVPALTEQGDISAHNFSKPIGLLQADLDELNRIKKEYQEKKKKSIMALGT